MKLQGFMCDNCGEKSVEHPRNNKWIEVSSLMLNASGFSTLMSSSGLHYCKKECLIEAAGKWPPR